MIQIQIEDSVPKHLRHYMLGIIHGATTNVGLNFCLDYAGDGDSMMDGIRNPDGRRFSIDKLRAEDQEAEG